MVGALWPAIDANACCGAYMRQGASRQKGVPAFWLSSTGGGISGQGRAHSAGPRVGCAPWASVQGGRWQSASVLLSW
eukprot:365077-Chlamydomonas_euryale.AAC.1